MDYGNTPRATPCLVGDRALLLGAFGDLNCVELSTGKPIWHVNMRWDFGGNLPVWGFCGSPLVVDETIYIQPNAPDASMVALDLKTGKTIWETPGGSVGYQSLVTLIAGGRRQIVGSDQARFVGWDSATGKVVWELKPDIPGEFFVPTPIVGDGWLLLCGEQNGTRLHYFDELGALRHSPANVFKELAPESHTPVVVGDCLVGVQGRLVCLELPSLKLRGTDNDPDLDGYCSIISDGRSKTLTLTVGGQLILHDYRTGQPRQLGKRSLSKDRVEVYAHPAIVGHRFYCRLGNRLCCLELGDRVDPVPEPPPASR